MVELTYFVLVAAVTVSLTTVTWSGFALRLPIILAAVAGHAFFLYQWAWVSEIDAESWFTLYFVTMLPLVVGLVLCLTRGSRSRAAFLALAYCAFLAMMMAINSMLLCRKGIAMSEEGRLLAICGVVIAVNFAFVFLVSRRVALCHRQSSWGLPTLAVGLMFALQVASGLWPVSLIAASRAELVVFALAALATGVVIPALCHPSHDKARDAEDEDESEEKRGVGGEVKRLGEGEGEVKRSGEGEGEVKRSGGVEQRNSTAAAEPLTDGEATSSSLQRQDESCAKRHIHSSPSPNLFTSPSPSPSPNLFTSPSPSPSPNLFTSSSSPSGEALFEQARAIPHRLIPDFDHDGPYLKLLGKSAAAGHVPALAKLGEYAMRRGAWVEAYYWMTLAKRGGMKNLDAVLREIRMAWSMEGFPNQSQNVNALFTLEAGSVGRALLHLDSGHEAAAAREFLKENHPEFLAERTITWDHMGTPLSDNCAY